MVTMMERKTPREIRRLSIMTILTTLKNNQGANIASGIDRCSIDHVNLGQCDKGNLSNGLR
jgi:hypothetical protein